LVDDAADRAAAAQRQQDHADAEQHASQAADGAEDPQQGDETKQMAHVNS
jgi:hypothetical protein